MGLRLRMALPHALREAALICAMCGYLWIARALLKLSISAAQRQEARHELAQTLSARARIGRELGWKSADEDRQRSEALFRDLALAADGARSDPECATFSL